MEFRSHVIRLLLHREASQIIADIYELHANATERSILLRDVYTREATLVPLPQKDDDAAKDVRGGLPVQFEKLSNRARFVKMIVSNELVVSNRKKVDIVEELRQKQFRPFPKAAKAKAAGEMGRYEEAKEAATGTSTDYDYLLGGLGLTILSLTKEKACLCSHVMTLAYQVCIHSARSHPPQRGRLRPAAYHRMRRVHRVDNFTAMDTRGYEQRRRHRAHPRDPRSPLCPVLVRHRHAATDAHRPPPAALPVTPGIPRAAASAASPSTATSAAHRPDVQHTVTDFIYH